MKLFFLILIIVVVSSPLYSQTADSADLQEDVLVLARPSEDSITLRWAPRNYQAWVDGNKFGFSIERYTIVRNKQVLVSPEKKALTQVPIRPQPLEQWEALVKINRHAAIAAQAIFGDDFKVNLEETDVVAIVNQVNENEQRFAFALFAADLSPATAQKSGLWFSDTTAKVDEKYLYRIVVNNDSLTRRGSVFAGIEDSTHLPSPRSFTVEGLGSQVSLRWREIDLPIYSWYAIERSVDTINFRTISDVPVVTLSPSSTDNTSFLYASDSIPIPDKDYYYRIRGVTPFGEFGPASQIVRLRSEKQTFQAPYIVSAVSNDNLSISITWEFLESQKLRGFHVERSSNDGGPFVKLTGTAPLAPQIRSYTDFKALPINYYRITAIGDANISQVSQTFLVTLIDSIPPNRPQNLQGIIDDNGILVLGWEKNSEDDLEGYRIFKSNHISEEAFQLTKETIRENTYSDRINLMTLNKFLYYSVMAVDHNQNHSSLSTILKVKLPDKVSPVPPAILPLKVDSTGISVTWTKSSSEDVSHYEIYRAEWQSDQWIRIRLHKPNNDSSFIYKDIPRQAGKYKYTVVASDSAGNESQKATPVAAVYRKKSLLNPVLWKQPKVDPGGNSVTIHWDYFVPDIQEFKLFKSIGNQEFSLLKTLPGNARLFVDKLAKGQSCRYRIFAISNDGYKSSLSGILDVKY